MINFLQIFHPKDARRRKWFKATLTDSSLLKNWGMTPRLSFKSYTLFRWAFTRRLKADKSYISGKQLAGRLFHWFAVRTKKLHADDREIVRLWEIWTQKEWTAELTTVKPKHHTNSLLRWHHNHILTYTHQNSRSSAATIPGTNTQLNRAKQTQHQLQQNSSHTLHTWPTRTAHQTKPQNPGTTLTTSNNKIFEVNLP